MFATSIRNDMFFFIHNSLSDLFTQTDNKVMSGKKIIITLESNVKVMRKKGNYHLFETLLIVTQILLDSTKCTIIRNVEREVENMNTNIRM